MEQLVDNRYEIVRTIGSGGMADVFLAHDNVLDRDVALKVMNSRYARDDEFVERFRREAQSAAALSHPNIVSIYDRGESEDGTYYIAMEYLSGGTLKDRVLKRGALPPKTAASVAAQIAEALKAAHSRGVVHRDIKPHNILITEAGDIKVTDFGIARAASSSTMTKTGAVMGTAHYISPEQAMGESVGPASDLYSLGVLLYEMLTGELPFDADTPIGIAMQHVNGTPNPPREVNPEVPAGLNAVVVKLLQKDPEDRYPSDEALIEDLERIARGGSPTSAAATQVMNGLDRTSVLAAGANSQTRAMTSPSVTRENERPQKRRRRRFLPAFLILLLLALLGLGGYSLLSGAGAPETNEAPQAAELEVPDLSGLTLEEARGDQAGQRFDITQGGEENSPEARGTILDQDPASGETLTEGSEIQVTTASGSNSVPEVVDLTQENATQDVQDAGFEVQVEVRESDEADSGRVLSQNPGGGSNEEVGSAITVTVGSGPGLVSVPDIPVGSTQTDGTSILQNAGLSLGNVTEMASSTVAEGGVIDQSPNPGEEVEEGSAVDIVVSSGPEQVEVPDVTGQDLDSALATLGGLGLGYTPVGVESDVPEGTVISTDPVGGTMIDFDENAIVTVTYSLGVAQQEPVVTPSPTPAPTDDSGASDDDGVADDVSGSGGSSDDSDQDDGGERPSVETPPPSPRDDANGNDGGSGQPSSGRQPGAQRPGSAGGTGSGDRSSQTEEAQGSLREQLVPTLSEAEDEEGSSSSREGQILS